ncbi:MAG: homocysteine S-methyltransferase family protein [Ignavibacteriaceae bacterium]
MNLTELLKSEKILVSDGAWGTYLFKLGLQPGHCPEEWNLSHPEAIVEIAESYIKAGSDIISTNSFGGNKLKLSQYGLEQDTENLNMSAALISRKAAGSKIVFGSIGPTGIFLITGEVTEQELYESFAEQSSSLAKGGVDGILLETFYDLEEAQIALKAVKENTKLSVACTFTFDKQPDGSYRTITGISPADMTNRLSMLEVDIIGTNCGQGFQNITEITAAIRKVNSNIPLMVQANAGLPINVDGKIVYTETPENIIPFVNKLIDLKVNIIGGCCGTTTDHIKTIRNIVDIYNLSVN